MFCNLRDNAEVLKNIFSDVKDEILYHVGKPISQIKKLNISPDDLKEVLTDIAIQCFIECKQQCNIGPEILSRSLGYSTTKTYKHCFNDIRYKLQKATEHGICKLDRTPFKLINQGFRDFGTDYKVKNCKKDVLLLVILFYLDLCFQICYNILCSVIII